MSDHSDGPAGFLAELKRRRVYRAGALHLMVSFVAWQVAEIAVQALVLPDVVLTVVVVGSIVLFPVTLVGAWVYDLRVHRDPADLPPPLRRFLEHSRVRSVLIMGVASVVVVVTTVIAASRIGPRVGADDEGTRIAVFPLSTVSLDDSPYGEGIAELLNVGLDGIPGLHVLDPSAYWPPVLAAGLGPAPRANEGEYLETSRRFGIQKYVTGTVVMAGAAMDVNVRVHDGRSGDELASVRASAMVDSLSTLVDELIVGLAAELWDGAQAPEVRGIDRFTTSVPVALQSYLEAMRHHRRGHIAAAEREIELAVAADSTFALAHLAHFRIRSWRLQMDGDPLVGLAEIVARADRHKDRLTPRGRFAVAASMALNRTHGADAIDQLERILDVDPDDVAAHAHRAFTIASYGWQFGRDRDDARDAYDRALSLDPSSLPLLELRAGIAMRDRDFATAEALLARMEAVGPESPLSVGGRLVLDLISAPDEVVDSIIDANLDASLVVAIHVIRRGRSVAPDRALRWSQRLYEEAPGVRGRAVGLGSVFQIALGAGALSMAEETMRSDGVSPYLRQTMLFRLLAADLVGVGDRARSEVAVEELAEAVPPDSVVAYLETSPEPWAVAWVVGAWHAALGDTAVARAYRDGIAASPRGGIPPDWPEALAADIDARLARRARDPDGAMEHALRAYELWTIHDPIAGEWYPEPAIRFHLAELRRESGDTGGAAALYQSFVHYTWVGFYTPLAAYRLALHQTAMNDTEGARFALQQAVDLWSLGDIDVVGGRLAAAREALDGLQAARGSLPTTSADQPNLRAGR